MHFLQSRDDEAALLRASAAAHITERPDPLPGAASMSHHDDHIRLAFGAPRPVGRSSRATSRARARNTDVDTVLDKLGLSGLVRKF